MAQHPEVFEPFYLSLFRAGEASGSLASALIRLANHFERSMASRQKVRQAMLQPSLILATACVVVWVLLTQVMLKFAAIYAQQNELLPRITQEVLAVSDLVIRGNFQSIGLLSLTILMLFAVSKASRFGFFLHRLVQRLPLIGKLSRCINVSETCRILSTTLRADIPLMSCLPLAGNACRNFVYQVAILTVQTQLKGGGKVSDALASTSVFPTAMVRLSEESGKLDEVLEQAKRYYEEEVNRTYASVLPLIEPLLLLLLGLVIGGLVLAMYLPIFAMGDMFQP